MSSETPRSTARIGGHPIHPMLAPIPIACFAGTFVTDIVYWRTAAIMWADFSDWLLAVGLLFAALAIIAGLIDFFGDRRIRSLGAAWIHGAGNGLAVLLSLVNAFVHSRDAYTSVVPEGIILSGLVVLILLVTGWMGWEMVYRRGVGVHTEARS